MRRIHLSPVDCPHKGQWREAWFFYLRLNKWGSKQSGRRWFETPLLSLWRHYNGTENKCVYTMIRYIANASIPVIWLPRLRSPLYYNVVGESMCIGKDWYQCFDVMWLMLFQRNNNQMWGLSACVWECIWNITFGCKLNYKPFDCGETSTWNNSNMFSQGSGTVHSDISNSTLL